MSQRHLLVQSVLLLTPPMHVPIQGYIPKDVNKELDFIHFGLPRPSNFGCALQLSCRAW